MKATTANNKRYFKKLDSPHILVYNPSFEGNEEFQELPSDFDLEAYQEHMKETKGHPTRLVEDFCGFHVVPVKEDVVEIDEDIDYDTLSNPIMSDIVIDNVIEEIVEEDAEEKIEEVVDKPKPKTRAPRKTTKRGRPRKK